MALFTALGFRRPPSMQGPKKAVLHELNFQETAAILEPDRDRLRLPPLDLPATRAFFKEAVFA